MNFVISKEVLGVHQRPSAAVLREMLVGILMCDRGRPLYPFSGSPSLKALPPPFAPAHRYSLTNPF